MKAFLVIVSIFAPFILVMALTGVYPVALVDGSPVFFKTWKRLEESAKHFENAQAKNRVGGEVVDFSLYANRKPLLKIQRDTLTELIENRILDQEGRKLEDSFAVLTKDKMGEMVSSDPEYKRKIKEDYGMELIDYNKFILFPKAQREVIKIVLAGKNQDFDEWLAGIKRKKNVRLLFVPFRWDGERVR